jgi:hypothetical protein
MFALTSSPSFNSVKILIHFSSSLISIKIDFNISLVRLSVKVKVILLVSILSLFIVIFLFSTLKSDAFIWVKNDVFILLIRYSKSTT